MSGYALFSSTGGGGGGMADQTSLVADEPLFAGAFVYVAPNSRVRLASSNPGGNPAMGFVINNVVAGSIATIYFEGSNNVLSGLTVGSRYYLGPNGGVITSPVSSAGSLHQFLGRAFTTSAISTEISDHILRA